MERLSDYLKEQREKKGIRLEEIASITKIHLKSLEHLENGLWEQLPPEPFIRGFITAYSKYIGLDPREILSRYHAERTGQLENPPVPQPEGGVAIPAGENPSEIIEQSRSAFSLKWVAGIVGVLLVLVVGSLIYLWKKKETNYFEQVRVEPEAPVAAVPPAEPSLLAQQIHKTSADEPAPAVTNPAKSEPKTEVKSETSVAKAPSPAVTNSTVPATGPLNGVPKPEEKLSTNADAVAGVSTTSATVAAPPAHPTVETYQHEVVLEGSDRTWTKVVIDDAKPVEFFLNKGDRISYKAKTKIKIVLGNYTASKVFHNGQVDTGEKYQGTIYSYVFPREARFPQDVPAKRATATNQAAPADTKVTPESQQEAAEEGEE